MESLEQHNETVDRKSAVTLHAKQAFLDWVAAIAPHHPLIPSKWTAQQLIASRESIAWIIPSVGQFDSGADLQSYLSRRTGSQLPGDHASFASKRLLSRYAGYTVSC